MKTQKIFDSFSLVIEVISVGTKCVCSTIKQGFKPVFRQAKEIIDGIIAKCFSSKPKTKEVATELCLQLLEHEQADTVTTCLLEGAQNKNPKVAAASVIGNV